MDDLGAGGKQQMGGCDHPARGIGLDVKKFLRRVSTERASTPQERHRADQEQETGQAGILIRRWHRAAAGESSAPAPAVPSRQTARKNLPSEILLPAPPTV